MGSWLPMALQTTSSPKAYRSLSKRWQNELRIRRLGSLLWDCAINYIHKVSLMWLYTPEWNKKNKRHAKKEKKSQNVLTMFNYKQLRNAERRRKTFPQRRTHINWLSNNVWSILKSHIQKTHRISYVFVNMCLSHICICIYSNSKWISLWILERKESMCNISEGRNGGQNDVQKQ